MINDKQSFLIFWYIFSLIIQGNQQNTSGVQTKI